MNSETIPKSLVDIGNLIQGGYYGSLNEWDKSWDKKMNEMHPILEFSGEGIFEIIEKGIYGMQDFKLATKEVKLEFLQQKSRNYWYVPGKLLKNEIRIFFMEKPQYDMILTVDGL